MIPSFGARCAALGLAWATHLALAGAIGPQSARAAATSGEVDVAAPAGSRDAGAPSAAIDVSLSAELLVGSSGLAGQALRAHVEHLTRAEWDGRAPGSRGADSAAAYVERRFRAAGLVSARPGGSLLLPTPLSVGVRIQGVIGLRDERRGYSFGRDYRPLGFSADGHVLAPLAFAGFGIEDGADGAGAELEGKAVVLFAGARGGAARSGAAAATYPGWSTTPEGKAREAARRDAAAAFLVTPPEGPEPADALWGTSQERGYTDVGIPVCHLTASAAESLLAPGGLDLSRLQEEIDRTGRSRSRVLPADSVEVLVEARRLAGSATNVVALLPGASEETVVVAACLDGYGRVPSPSGAAACPGADDNASGTAALCELARALAAGPPPFRTLCFVAFAGRDLSGAGFETFLRDGGIDRARIAAVIELAALGNARASGLLCAGGGVPMADLVRGVHDLVPERLELRVSPRAPAATLPARLEDEGIRALGFSSGTQAVHGTPADVVEGLDFEAEARACRLIYGVIRALAERD